MQYAPEKKNGDDGLPIPPYKVYNIGNSSPENLLDFVNILQEELVYAGVLSTHYDFEAHKELVPMQPGDVPVTCADISALENDFGFKPHTSLREGLQKFVEWYKKNTDSLGIMNNMLDSDSSEGTNNDSSPFLRYTILLLQHELDYIVCQIRTFNYR